MKATIETKDMVVIFEGKESVVVEGLRDFFIGDGEGEGDPRSCARCFYEKTPGDMQPCDLCDRGGSEFKPKPEGGEYKPNYAVHPAETIKEIMGTQEFLTPSQALHLAAAFGQSDQFWLNLWRNYEAACKRGAK